MKTKPLSKMYSRPIVRLSGYCILLLFAAFAGCSEDGGGGGKKNDDESDDPASNAEIPVYEADDAPPHAASDKVWVIGTQEWSDFIQIPACNKDNYDVGSFEVPRADCRSVLNDGKTYYHYTWPYVNRNASTLCPSPWRVPTESDFDVLCNLSDDEQYAIWVSWGHGGALYAGNSWRWAESFLWSRDRAPVASHQSIYMFECAINFALAEGTQRLLNSVRCVRNAN
jgi:hypothetical protein